jgi:ribosomal protein S18 acetylase RimI-like enzyme
LSRFPDEPTDHFVQNSWKNSGITSKQQNTTMLLAAPPNDTTETEIADCAAVSAKVNRNGPARSESSIAERKLGFLKRTGLFGRDLKGCTIERACSAEDLRQAYRLVHDVFLGSGFIDPDPSGMRLRIYETTAETATFIAKEGSRVVAVLSVVEDTGDLGLPSDCVFKPELDALRDAGRRLCEFTNQAVAEDYRKSAIPTELMRCATAFSLTKGFDEAIAAVSPSHGGFYDLLGFRHIGSQRSYSETIDDPVVAVSMDIDLYRTPRNDLTTAGEFIRQFFTEGNHFFSRMAEWAQEARRQFLNPDLLKQLFIVERNILAACSSAELAILQRRWGYETFVAVVANTPISTIFASASSRQRPLPRRRPRVRSLPQSGVPARGFMRGSLRPSSGGTRSFRSISISRGG